jgi:CIC family chloride channel protein
VAGTTHGPITAILIIFELTGDYKIILPLMVSCVISTFITTSLKEGSIYTIKLKRRGLDIYRGLEQIILKTFKVKDVMREEIQFILEKAKFDEIIETFSKSRHSYLLVTNDQGELTGVISFHDVRKFITSRDESSFLRAKDIATKNIVSLIPADTLQTALRKISMLGVSQLPVVAEGNSKKVLGIVTSKDIITFYERQLVSRELV